mmetsp:Transcript_18677/g.56447  ORF Transcript_18677/g.56447 Transcript_18677/m.56447 type:complete len:319 (+) Transcript_18677:783-1739(+)
MAGHPSTHNVPHHVPGRVRLQRQRAAVGPRHTVAGIKQGGLELLVAGWRTLEGGGHRVQIQVQGAVGQLFCHAGQDAPQLGLPRIRAFVCLEVGQHGGDGGAVVQGVRPVGAAHGEGAPRVRAHLRHRRSCPRHVLHPRALHGLAPHALKVEGVAALALPHVSQLRRGVLDCRCAGVHPHKHPDVEVDGQGHDGHDVALVPVGMPLNAGQQDAHRHLVAVRPVEGVATVLAPACLPVVSTQHCHVSGSDQKQAALRHCLDRRVKKLGGGSVWVQIHSIVQPSVLHHQHARVPLPRSDPLSCAAVEGYVTPHGVHHRRI